MEITQHPEGDVLELAVKGRLDAYWAEHLATTLDETIRRGTHRLKLNLAGVTYISSMGVGVLVRFQRELRKIGGSLKVVEPSDVVKEVLELSGLMPILVAPPRPAEQAGAATTWKLYAPKRGREQERGAATFEIFEYDVADATCCVIGDPGRLRGCRFDASNCRALSFPSSLFGLGLGALGQRVEESRDRLGEFLAVAGTAAYLPTDGTNVPDHVMAANAAPAVTACYGATCDAAFSRLLRFEANPNATLPLSELAEAALEFSGANAIGVVTVAETTGLMGAALRRSPALGGDAGAPFAHPQVRDWLSFTAERAYPHCLALIVGVAARTPPDALAPFLRPLGPNPTPVGHFHAAAFSYRPIQKGEIDLKETVSMLFESQRLQGILHLLGDFRPQAGLGQSEFVRGACWIAPVGRVVTE